MIHCMNDHWFFTKLPSGSTCADAAAASFAPVDLPHDWLIWQDDLYENSDGWYRRTLRAQADGLVRILRFDGVHMDCDVLLNGETLCTHHYGYTCFDVDMTDHLHEGENTLMVHVRHRSPCSRWYTGAGIFRDVQLMELPQDHIVPDGVYVHSEETPEGWRVQITTETVGEGEVHQRLLDAQGVTVAEGSGADCVLTVLQPQLWSCEAPYLYTLESTFGKHSVRQRVGLRSIRMDPDMGLFVNGQPVKLHGVCLHHDLGALGAAFHEKAARRQLRLMQRMGANALRTAHNPPARQVMEMCDEMGILVLNELYDMWHRAKTPYDNARFFDTDMEQDVAAWVRRDRNHPSLLMWSVGNEIQETLIDADAPEITRRLMEQVLRHDPAQNGRATIGLNYMPWEGAQKCVDVLKIGGYNYAEKLYAAHHAQHPDWVIYGSETSSLVSSRGIYHFPADTPILSDADEQCSALGNSLTSWGTKDVRRLIVDDLQTPYTMGQFIWSGIDYIGEPTPYHTRGSYYGYADTACFPKDLYYLFQALWTDQPVLHIGVHWDWSAGQLIDVNVMTNAVYVELFLNGRSLGRQQVERNDASRCMPRWRVPFEKGELKACGYDAAGRLVGTDVRCSFGDSRRIVLTAEDSALLADAHDMTFVTISTVDEHGVPVDNAVDRIRVKVTGGVLMGLDNGDASETDRFKGDSMRLFSGKLLAMVGATDKAGEIRVEATAPGLEGAALTLPALPSAPKQGRTRSMTCAAVEADERIPVRRIELLPQSSTHLTPEHPEVRFRWRCLSEDAAPQALTWQITNAATIDSTCASLTAAQVDVTVRASGDGVAYLRALCTNGADHPRIISHMEVTMDGFGTPNLDPYGFVTGGLYDLCSGEISPGNDKGIAFARDGRSMAGFSRVDFGPDGSDEITLPIFALDGNRYELALYIGHPDEGGELLCVLPYQKPSKWNVYQPQTYRLPRKLRGLQTLCFVMEKKIHLKGFSFTRQSRAWQRLNALEADHIYGDSFQRTAHGVEKIGNNVSLVFERMDFENAQQATLVVDGRTPLSENPITVRIQNEAGEEITELAAFQQGDGEQRFPLHVLGGMCTVTFVFLPGCQFDFRTLQFER